MSNGLFANTSVIMMTLTSWRYPELKDVKLVLHPIAPEKFEKTEHNKVSLYDYPHPVDIVVVGVRKLVAIDYKPMKKTSSYITALQEYH